MFSSLWGGITNAFNSVYNTVAPLFSGSSQTASAANASQVPNSSPVNYSNAPSTAFMTNQSGGSSNMPGYLPPAPTRTISPSPSGSMPNASQVPPSAFASQVPLSYSSGSTNTNSLSYSPTGLSGANSFMVNTSPTTLSSSSLASSTPTVITPSAPSSPKNYAGSAIPNNVALGADPKTGMFGTTTSSPTAPKLNSDGTPVTEDKTKDDAKATFDKYIASLKQPASEAEAYNRATAQSGLLAAQQQKQNTQNQINAITSKMNTDLLQLRGTAGKEGVTEAVYGGQQAEITREATIRLLPLQAQLAADQGNLELATTNTNTLFKIYADDAKNSVDMYNKQLELGWDFFDNKEKEKAKELLWQKDFNAKEVQSAADNQAKAALELLKAGDKAGYLAVTGIQIPSNVNSPTFADDYGTYQKNLASTVARYAGSVPTTYTVGADPVADSWVQAVLNGNSTMAQVPAAYKNRVALGLNSMPGGAYSPLAGSRYTLEATRIAKNYIDLPQFQLTANGLPYLQRIDAAMKTPGSVSDQDLLDSLTKLNTAGNAISDAQVRLVTDGRSFSDAVSVWENKLGNGGVLSDNQRQQIQTIAKSIFANYQKGYEPVYNQVVSQLTAAGIPKAFWTIPDLNNLSAQAGGAQTSAGVLLSPDGTQQVSISDLTDAQIKEAKAAGWK